MDYLFASKLFEGEKATRNDKQYVCGIRRQSDNALIYRFEADEQELAQETLDRLNSAEPIAA